MTYTCAYIYPDGSLMKLVPGRIRPYLGLGGPGNGSLLQSRSGVLQLDGGAVRFTWSYSPGDRVAHVETFHGGGVLAATGLVLPGLEAVAETRALREFHA